MEKGKIAQNEQFHLFPQCFLCNLYILKSFNGHISVVYSFFEFGMVSKWCIWEWVNSLPNGKTLDWPIFKAFAENKTNMIEKLKFL